MGVLVEHIRVTGLLTGRLQELVSTSSQNWGPITLTRLSLLVLSPTGLKSCFQAVVNAVISKLRNFVTFSYED